MTVREKPPLDVSLGVVTPSGRRYRWAGDEQQGHNVPSGLRWSDTMPGGFETLDVTLPRKSGTDYGDLEPLSTITVYDAGGGIVGEYRLERVPRSSGGQLSVSPSAVGWQAHLADDKAVRFIYRDIDLSHWGSASRERESALLNAGHHVDGSVSVVSDKATGSPGVYLSWTRVASDPAGPQRLEAWYDPHGLRIDSVYYDYVSLGVGAADADWTAQMRLTTLDTGGVETAGTNHMGTPATATLTAGEDRRYAVWLMQYAGTFQDDGDWAQWIRKVAVYGPHGLTLRGGEPAGGLLASDIVMHAVRTWAPLIQYRENDTVIPSLFQVPHLAYFDATTVGQIVTDASRFELPDWGVWENRTLYYGPPGTFGRNWLARVAPARLEEAGPQVDRLWESIIVQYRAPDGSTQTVGPPGSGADTETDALKDDDPENPANQLGITRREVLTLDANTEDGAIEVGQRFLEETKALNTAGRATLVGYVEDDHGVTWPYHKVRSGDTVTFVDASDPSPRRVVRSEKDDASRSCTVELDAPPDGLAALLERLGARLQRL